MTSPIYRSPEPHEEARSRLVSLLSVCEHELASLEKIGDDNLTTIIQHMRSFHEEPRSPRSPSRPILPPSPWSRSRFLPAKERRRAMAALLWVRHA
jgi:hypothetical protein